MAVTEATMNAILSINGIATFCICLLCIHFIYNVYIQTRVASPSITIKINNSMHFQSVSLMQTLIFILTCISCIICTFFISDITFSNISSNLCSSLYSLSYSGWFIARYLCVLMFIFRAYNIIKIFAPKCKRLLYALFFIITVINIPIIVLYFYISSPSLITDDASNITVCLGIYVQSVVHCFVIL